MPSDRVFELGVVLAGAVSAGAYSAGVMDFIFEALDAYEVEKLKDGWDGPTHSVRIPVMSGASAGGMTAAIAALHAFRELEHVWPDKPAPPRPSNRLYSSWVTDISIEELLQTSDLDGDRASHGVRSALCSDVLERIVNDAFDIDGPLRVRKWLGRGTDHSLRIMLTLTNIRGVPYSFPLGGADPTQRFGMLSHADYLDFRVGVSPASADGLHCLDISDAKDPGRALFGTAALATGAFPIGLAPRHIQRAASDYWIGGKVGYYDQKDNFVTIPPDKRLPPGAYSFVSVDGGTIDNEPLELARRYLAGAAGRNPQDGQDADKAVVLIAPFPNYSDSPSADEQDNVLHVAKLMASALIDQARFKPDELAQAANDKIFSRFVISPVGPADANPMAKKYPIASGALGGFSGFLDESFRRHDYLLGRRNAQAFLRWNFALPETNPLFAGGRPIDGKWRVADADGATGSLGAQDDLALRKKPFATTVSGEETQFGLPIIPLTEALRKPIEIGTADRPRPEALDLDKLHALIRTRANKVVEILVDVDFRLETNKLGPILGPLAREGGRMFGTEVATQKAIAIVDDAIGELIQAFPARPAAGT
jgi:hypothetical protein